MGSDLPHGLLVVNKAFRFIRFALAFTCQYAVIYYAVMSNDDEFTSQILFVVLVNIVC